MHKKFDHKAIEKKWQEKWEEEKLYEIPLDTDNKNKEYVLVEWPYPSGNLHIGHWYAFAVPDIYVRFLRMQGKTVLFPIGFDAFGLPAENAAIKHGVSPKEWTDQNINYMKNQLRSMGNAFSWNATTSSTDPDYYKWTQWMFTQFVENDIAYKGEGLVNWCPGCQTVIANEQVADGVCERCGSTVEKKSMPQWMIRITDFADQLIEDLGGLDWPSHIKEAQRNWIGRAKGAEISFKLTTSQSVSVFTTRPETIYGATYLVLAPEHKLVLENKDTIENWSEVETYIKKSAEKDEQDRLATGKEKTGVLIKGLTAINPANDEEIPVFIADYVLASYGTGAIMAVPAHDERDFEFARKFKLKIVPVIDPASVHGGNFKDFINDILDGKAYITEPGVLINSGEFSGMYSEEAKEKIVKKIDGRMTNTYRLRDWSIGRQRYWGVPIPIVYDPEGEAHIVPKEHLPWILPEDVDFTPTGEPPLLKSKELKTRTEEIFGEGWTPEVETMDTFVDSSWYYLRYIDNKNEESFSSKKAQNSWMPVDIYFGGAEHTTMHLLYSRFWQKALYKLGLVQYNEPYRHRINRGLILDEKGVKMSKSKGNVIDPDMQVEKLGADTVKMYLAFLGPYQGTNYPWDMGGIAGIHRFLERVNGLDEHIAGEESSEVTSLIHKTVKKVSEDIKEYKFNTAISALMITINTIEKSHITLDSYLTLLRVLAPFAPHLTEELWEKQGQKGSIHSQTFPEFNEALLIEEEVVIGVQINGKLRGEITVAPDASEDEAWNLIEDSPDLKNKLTEKEIVKKIYVPGKIFNIVVK